MFSQTLCNLKTITAKMQSMTLIVYNIKTHMVLQGFLQ